MSKFNNSDYAAAWTKWFNAEAMVSKQISDGVAKEDVDVSESNTAFVEFERITKKINHEDLN